MKKTGILLVLLFVPAAQAETTFYGAFGVTYGGDELASIIFTDNSSEDLRAGSGYTMAIGVVHHFENSPLSLRVDAGYFADETSAENSRARFSRYPIEVVGVLRNGDHRFGGGFVHHLSPTLNMDNLGGKIEFGAATGYVMEYGYRYFSVRYTNLNYGGVFEVDGSGVGLFVETGF